MADLYLRKIAVTLISQTGFTKTMDKLRFIFSCEKTNEKTTNKATLDIYNLNKDSRGILESKNSRIVIEAGYETTKQVIFQGDITKVVHESEPPDIISKCELGDGDNSYRTSRMDVSLPPGATTQQAFNEVISKSGMNVGAVLGIPSTKYANGLVLSGMVRDVLDELCKKNDLEWSIQNEALQIIPKNSFTLDSIVILNSKTGLVGSPSKTKDGVEFTSLLQPTLNPGRRVKIESKLINGIYKVRKVIHEGDSHGGDFVSKCEATIS